MLVTRSLLLLAVAAASGAVARAQSFEFGKREEVKAVEWKATASAGMILTTGNSRALALSGSALISRRDGDDKLTLEGSGAFARSELRIAIDQNGNGTVGPDEVTRDSQTTTKNWLAKLRYDRFFAGANSAFLSGRLGADEPAGKTLYGGGQIGYSRQLFKNDVHEIISEIGYDLTYESYVSPDAPNLAIHSARVFLGYNAKLSDDTGFLANIEALFNLNSETGPTGEIDPFEDTRLTAKAALTTKLFSRVSFRFSFTAKYDNAPAPLPTFGAPYDPGFIPLADKLDAITEVALIVSFI
jgi:hypothetical protein